VHARRLSIAASDGQHSSISRYDLPVVGLLGYIDERASELWRLCDGQCDLAAGRLASRPALLQAVRSSAAAAPRPGAGWSSTQYKAIVRLVNTIHKRRDPITPSILLGDGDVSLAAGCIAGTFNER